MEFERLYVFISLCIIFYSFPNDENHFTHPPKCEQGQHNNKCGDTCAQCIDHAKSCTKLKGSEQKMSDNMDLQHTNFDDSPEWLQNWWIQQEEERERLKKLDSQYPGAPHPDPPVRPPKRPELRDALQNNNQV